MTRIPLLLFFILTCPDVLGQVTDLRYAEAKTLRDNFKEDEIAATRSVTTFEFIVDKNRGLLVRERTTANFLSLRANAQLILRSFSNSHELIESYSLKNEKGKSVHPNEYCGHQVSQGIFYTDGQICIYEAVLPQVGQSVDYDISTLYTDPKYFTHGMFIDEYPAKYRELKFTVPDGVKIELVEVNFAGYNIVKTVDHIQGATTFTFTIHMAEGYPKEEHLPGSLHFMPHLLVLCKGYTNRAGVEQTVLTTTADLYRWYASLTNLMDNDYESLKPLVSELISNAKTDEEKMTVIYYWVQDNIKYIAFEDGVAAFKPEDAKKVYYNRFGDCKGMANLAKAMMTLAGLDARLTWIGTTKIPYTYSTPSIAVDNHMICTVFINGNQYILDPTEKYNQVGSYAERIQGKEIMIENGSTYLLSKVPVVPLELAYDQSHVTLRIDDKRLAGNATTTLSGELRTRVRQVLPDLKQVDQGKFLKNIISWQADPDEFEITQQPSMNRDSLATIRYLIKLNNRLYQNNKELYVDLDFDKAYGNVKMEKGRKKPYKFSERVFKEVRTELTLPEGYLVSHMPQPLHISAEHFEFDMSYETAGNKLIYKKAIRIPQATLPVSEFDAWNKAISEVNNFYNSQLALKENE
jgi:hypothetical protein